MKNSVKTPEDALIYLTECTLATVSHMSMLKSKNKGEFKRQIEIAQTAINWLKQFNLKIPINSRVYDVLSLPDQKVETWSKQFKC